MFLFLTAPYFIIWFTRSAIFSRILEILEIAVSIISRILEILEIHVFLYVWTPESIANMMFLGLGIRGILEI